MPMTITLASEFCPTARRSSLVTLMFCGFTLGSAMAGLIAARVLPGFGWRVLLVGGGLAPLVLLAPVLGALLPESVRFLVMKGDAQDRIAAVLRRIAPAADLRGASFVGTAGSKASPVAQLFGGGLLEGHAAPVAGVLHEPAGRLPDDELDADAAAAGVGRLARGRGIHRRDVPGRRHARGDSRGPADGPLRAAPRALCQPISPAPPASC